jgi:imidazolonepropionase-like amidohydrolase
LWRAGLTLGTGTDIWQIPTGVHLELEQLVAAGLTPAQAIHAGTGGAARILGADKRSRNDPGWEMGCARKNR